MPLCFFYGLNSWGHLPKILEDGFLEPSWLPERNATGGAPKIWGGTYNRAEGYATPHVMPRDIADNGDDNAHGFEALDHAQVMFSCYTFHAVKHPKGQKSKNGQQVYKMQWPTSVEICDLRIRPSGPPQKYHLHLRSPFSAPLAVEIESLEEIVRTYRTRYT